MNRHKSGETKFGESERWRRLGRAESHGPLRDNGASGHHEGPGHCQEGQRVQRVNFSWGLI